MSKTFSIRFLNVLLIAVVTLGLASPALPSAADSLARLPDHSVAEIAPTQQVAGRQANAPSPAVEPTAPTITATKTDALLIDNDGDGVADPGDTLQYTVVITNSGDMDATNVDFNDTIDANTTLVAGSLRTTPIGRHDTYVAIGNVGITVPAVNGLLTNDDDPDGTGAVTLVGISGCADTTAPFVCPAATNNGGDVTLNDDGSFTYDPAPGFEGIDFFDYTIQDGDGNLDPARVNFTVSGVIWFIDNTAAPGGDGRLKSPFDSLSDHNGNTADDNGDTIFIYSGSGAYSGGITVQNSQLLIGQGATASLASITGLTPPTHSNALPATGGTRPVITNSGGSGITLGSNNLLRGLNVGNTSTSSGAGVSGSSVGALSILEMSITDQGKALDINGGGTLSVSLNTVAVTASTNGGVSLQNTGGSVTISGLNVTTTGGTGLLANNAGSLSVTGSSNTVNSSGGTAVNISNTTIGASGVTFLSVSASNADTGITLNNTGSADFTVTGTGTTDGSGGTLQNLNDHGVELINAQDVSISNMNLTNAATTQEVPPNTPTCTDEPNGTNTGCNAPVHMVNASNISLTNLTINGSVQHGVNGNNVNGLSISNTDVSGIGNQPKENGMHFINLFGTVSLNNVTVNGSDTRNVLVENNTGAANISVANSTFNNATREDGFAIIGGNSANITFNVSDSTFAENQAVQLKAHAEDSSTVAVSFTGNTFDGNPAVPGNVGVDLAVRDGANLTFAVIGTLANPQTFQPFRSHAINVFASGGGTATGRVNGNTITGSAFGAGIRAVAQVTDINGFNPSITIEIDGNTISNVQGGGLAGIHIEGRDGTNNRIGVATINATVTNNNVTTNGADAAIQAYLSDLYLASTPQNRVCLNAARNATQANGGAFGETDFFFGNDAISGSNSGVAQMQGFAANVSNTWFNVNGNTSTTTPTPWADSLGPIGPGTCATVAQLLPTDNGMMVAETDTTTLSVAALGATRLHAASAVVPLAAAGLAESIVARFGEVTNQFLTTGIETSPAAANSPPRSQRTPGLARSAFVPLASGETINLDLGDLNPGQVVVITFDVTVDATIPSSVTKVCNQGLFTGDNVTNLLTDDPKVSGATDPTCTNVPQADLSIVKMGERDLGAGLITYTLTISNVGPAAADGATVFDPIPFGVTSWSWSCTGSGGASCTASGSSDINDSSTLLPADGVLAYTVRATLISNEVAITNTAVVTAPIQVHDAQDGNNTATHISNPRGNPAIQATKMANVSSARVGETITYTYRLTNTGDVVLTGLVASDDRLGSVPLGSATLAPTLFTTGILTYTVAEDDLPGPLTNTVTVTAFPPVGAAIATTAAESIDVKPALNFIYLPLIFSNTATAP